MNLKRRFAKLLGKDIQQTARMFSTRNGKDGLTIDLYGTVGDYWEYNEAQDLLNILTQNQAVKKIQLNVHSLGGYYLEGLAIMNQFRDHPGTVTATVMGTAASMASLLLMGADKVRVHEASWVMIHEAEMSAAGRASELKTEAEWLIGINEQAAQAYHSKTGLPIDEIHRMMTAETWMTGEQAVELGFADELIPLQQAQETASAQMKALANQPISFEALDVYNNIPLECLPSDQTATLLGRINKISLETPTMAKVTKQPTDKEIVAAQAVLAATKIKQPTLQQVALAKKVLASADEEESSTEENEEQSAQASATEIAQLCELAGKPEKTAEFLLAGKKPNEVRIELAALKQAELKAIPKVNTQFGEGVDLDKTKTMSEFAAESCQKQGLIKK